MIQCKNYSLRLPNCLCIPEQRPCKSLDRAVSFGFGNIQLLNICMDAFWRKLFDINPAYFSGNMQDLMAGGKLHIAQWGNDIAASIAICHFHRTLVWPLPSLVFDFTNTNTNPFNMNIFLDFNFAYLIHNPNDVFSLEF